MSSGQPESLQQEVTDLRNQLREKNHEISKLSAQVLGFTVDVDELKHHRQELRALNDFYKTQSDKFRQEAENAKGEALTLRGEAEKAREESQRARVEADNLREALRRSEDEGTRFKIGKQELQRELDALRSVAGQAEAEVDDCRKKILELERRLAIADRAGLQQGFQQGLGAPPSRESTSSLVEPMGELELEYVSYAQNSTAETNRPPSASGPSTTPMFRLEHAPQPMDVDLAIPSNSVGVAPNPRASTGKSEATSSSAAEVQTIAEDLKRSPSIELLDTPPPASQSTAPSLRKRGRRYNAEVAHPGNAVSTSQPSSKSLGKRKATTVDQAPATPSKKPKPSVAPPEDTIALSVGPGGMAHVEQRLQSRFHSWQAPTEVKAKDEEEWSPLTIPSPLPSPRVAPNCQLLGTPQAHSTAQPQPNTEPPAPPTHTTEGGNVQRPTFKFKQEDALVLPPSTIARYLADAPDLEIKPPPSDLHVPRTFLRLAYGGSDQQFLQYISAERNPSASLKKGKCKGDGKRRLVFPMPDMNPAMPVIPGHSGLLFASRHEVLENPPWGVFRRHLDGKTAKWLYLGEYESKLVGKMTKEEFNSQNDSVKRRWAKLLIEQKAFECYTSMRARIALRKAGVLPVKKVGEEEGTILAEMEAIKRDRGRPVDEEDIIDAFSRGDEAIDIIRMQCVSYDHVFAKDLEQRFPNYSQMLKDSRKEKNKAGTTKSKTNKTTSSSTASSRASASKKVAQSGPSTMLVDVKPASASTSSTTASSPLDSASGSTQAVRRSGRAVGRRRRWVEYEEDDEEQEVEQEVVQSDVSFYTSE